MEKKLEITNYFLQCVGTSLNQVSTERVLARYRTQKASYIFILFQPLITTFRKALARILRFMSNVIKFFAEL